MKPFESLSLVVPIFNEEETLQFTHDALLKLRAHPKLNEIKRYELVYVDDGSQDASWRILAGLQAPTGDIEIRTLRFSRNFGHSAAVIAGLDAASGEAIAIIDADLQDPPELIPEMLEKLLGGYDVVYGQRTARLDESLFKRFTAWFFYRLLSIMTGVDVPKDTGDFRVITKQVADAVRRCREQEPFLRGLMAWVGFRQTPFPYVRQGRKYGRTKYPFRKMVRFALAALLSFSLFPLRLTLYVGFFGLVASAALLVWALTARYYGHTVPGWTSLLVGFTFGQSITLSLVGVIGLYTGRIHAQVQGRPRYILREQANP